MSLQQSSKFKLRQLTMEAEETKPDLRPASTTPLEDESGNTQSQMNIIRSESVQHLRDTQSHQEPTKPQLTAKPLIPQQQQQQGSTYVEQTALDRLMNIQAHIKRSWQGISTLNSGKPGATNMCNKKRSVPQASGEQIEDEERFRFIMKIVMRLKDIEDECKNQQASNQIGRQSLVLAGGGGGANFYGQEGGSTAVVAPPPYVQFRAIRENQLLSNNATSQAYARNVYSDTSSSELLYKLLRGDTRLVRSILEANAFLPTESHDWNLLWSNSACKSYLYEGLNEYQKINHFPSSNEITRKDKLCQNVVRMQERHGKHYFDFIPDTYVLPEQFGDFYAHFQRLKSTQHKYCDTLRIEFISVSDAFAGGGFDLTSQA